ncbi:MAG: lipid A deacylase LpxR family protein [Rickettsiales bacterium]|nr:lipid A deacylase LpxR family protein [Rickettsiales bacterium]
MTKWVPVFLVSALMTTAAHAESFEQEATREFNKKPREQFLTLTVENDMFGGGSDRNYTSGVRLSWLDTATNPPKLSKYVDEFLPMFSVNDTTAVYYAVGHNLYTPRNIQTTTPDSRDRPYAAFLYGSLGMSTIVDNHQDRVELTAGVIGPAAMGKGIQEFVHGVVDSDDPAGWSHQLENEPGLMVSTQRLWPELYKAEIGNLHFRTSPYVGGTLGNIYTYSNTGVIFQLVPSKYKWQSLPPRVRPAMPGSGYFSVPENEFSWSVFAGIEGRAVARNIFLDGNSFENSPSVDKKYAVGDANIGLALTFGRTQMTYTLNWRSEEFHGQDRPDLFGAIGLGYRF